MTFTELGIKVIEGKVRWSAICPKCNDTRQKHRNALCLTVNNELGNSWWHCNHCGWSGNMDLMDKYDKVQEKSRMPKQIVETYSKEVREYLERRGIEPKTALKEKIYEFTMAGKPILGFPFYINLTLVNVKYFDLRWKPGQDSPKWWQMKKDLGTRSIFLGMQSLSFDVDEKKEVIITEGEWDWLTWKQCGYNNVISVPQGAPNPDAKEFEHEFDYANDKYVQSFFADVENIIFSTDNDAPGRVLRQQLAVIFGRERCKYIQYPVGYKDINDVFKGCNKDDKVLPALGKTGVDECYNNLSSFPIKGIIKPSDIREDLRTLSQEGFTPGLKCGVPEIDYLYTEKPKRLQVVTGEPGAGKSTYVRWHETNVVIKNNDLNIKYGWFSPENRPVAREYAKMAEVVTGQFFKEGWRNSMSPELRNKTLRWLEQHFFIISPDRRNFDTFNGKVIADKVNTLNSLCEYLVYLKKTENIFGYVIDAWNKIEHEQPKYMTETQYISKQLDLLLEFNEYYDLHGIIIAHPTKIEKIGINYRMPCLYDIKGSSSWKEKCDIGVILHRNINKKKKKEEITDDMDEDDKYYVDADTPTILRTERIRFEEEGNMNRIKIRMDYSKGGRFFVVEDEKKRQPKIEGALNPQKEEEEEVFETNNGGDLPF